MAKSVRNFTSMLENKFLTKLTEPIRKPGIKEICKGTKAIRKLLHVYKWRERGNSNMITGLCSYYYMVVVAVALYYMAIVLIES